MEADSFGVKNTMSTQPGRMLKKFPDIYEINMQEDAEQSLLTMDLYPFTGAKTLSDRPMPFRRSPVP